MTASLMAKLAQKEFQSGYRIIHPFPSTKNGETVRQIMAIYIIIFAGFI